MNPSEPDELHLSWSVQTIEEIWNLRGFNGAPFVEFQAAFTFLMIHLNDTLQYLDKTGRRINKKPGISEQNPSISDITDLVSKIRNAVCHLKSGERTFSVDSGMVKLHWAAVTGDHNTVVAGRPLYQVPDGDVGIILGDNIILIVRDIDFLIQDLVRRFSRNLRLKA